MPVEISGALDARGHRFAIVVSRFNEFFTRKLMEGAIDALVRHGASDDDITAAWVPGAFEIPLAVERFAKTGHYDAVIALGLVLRGQTTHHEIVAGEASRGVARVSQLTGIPCPLGIVSAESLEQAVDRSGGKQGNRGWDAAMAALEMVNLLPALDGRKKDDANGAEDDEHAGHEESRAAMRRRAKEPWASQEEVR